MNLSQKPDDDEDDEHFTGIPKGEPLDKTIFDILLIILCFFIFGTLLLYLPDILEILFPQ
jgi:hypothetical protein